MKAGYTSGILLTIQVICQGTADVRGERRGDSILLNENRLSGWNWPDRSVAVRLDSPGSVS